MSVVTNCILTFSVLEDVEKRIKDINKYFGDYKGFVSCNDEILPRGWYGGTKMLETNVCIGALNHLNIKDLVEHLKKIEWEEKENVQLIFQEQEEDRFKILTLTE